MSDLISKEDALLAIKDGLMNWEKVGDYNKALYGEIENAINSIPSAELQEFEWCTDCKEYDQEKHCCHRWTKVIRQTVEEMKATERTAKVENIEVEWGDDEYVHDRMGDMYHYGDCGNCGQTVSHNQKYCHECGARLEWK